MKALSLFLLMMPFVAWANPTPEAVALARYEPLIARSPFSPASSAAPTAPTASFARNYYLTGMATVGEKTFITLASREGKQVFSLMEGETREGMTFARAEWVPGVGRSRAVLIRDGQTATVAFDEVAMKAAPVATPAPTATAQTQQHGGWAGESDRGGWRGRRGGRGRGGGDWSNPEQRQYMREHRRAWYRAMQQQNQQSPQPPNAPQQYQRARPLQ